MKRLTPMDWMEIILSLIVGATFVAASIHKIMAPAEFARIIYGYDVFPGVIINFMAITVPFLELFGGLFLILRIFFRPALLIINLMLTGFIIVISYNLMRGHRFDCGCFSYADTTSIESTVYLLIRDALLLAAGIFIWFRSTRKKIRHQSLF